MMNFEWGNFLEFAIFLQDNHPDEMRESALRTAVSRAYYAGYHHVEEWFENEKKKGHKPPDLALGHSKHSAQIRRLKQYNRYAASTILNSTRLLRNSCDYELFIEGDLVFITKDVIAQIQKLIDILS